MAVERIPYVSLIPLALGSFLAIMTETMPVGMLPEIRHSLEISQALTGQLLTAYALGSFLFAIPIIALTRSINRKWLLLLALAGFCLTNLAVAATSSFSLILMERFLSGVAAALMWGLLPGYTLRITPSHLQGRALAIMGIGQPLALSFGVPLTSRLVTCFSWHTLFTMIAIIALITAVLSWITLPALTGEKNQDRIPLAHVITRFPILVLLLALWLWVTSHNVMYTYISSYLAVIHLSAHLDMTLLLFGLSAIVGVIMTSVYIDRNLNRITGLCILLFVTAMLLMLFFVTATSTSIGTLLWGVSFGGAPTLLMKYLSERAGRYMDVAQSGYVTCFNGAVASGSFLGGVTLEWCGARYLPFVTLLLSGALFLLFARYLKMPRSTHD